MENQKQKTKMSGKIFKAILIAIFLVFAVGGSFFAFRVVKGMVTSWEITDLPGVAIKPGEPTAESGADALPEISIQTPEDSLAPPAAALNIEPWDGASRVNVLVMGLDYNDWRAGEGPPRTDTPAPSRALAAARRQPA